MPAAPKRRRTSAQPHPLPTSSGRRKYLLIEHTDNGGKRVMGRYDSSGVAAEAGRAFRKLLPRGSSTYYRVVRDRRT